MLHVDQFIDNSAANSYSERYARFVLMLFRMPASLQMSFHTWTAQYKLFCTYEDKRYRCIGASRLGDVWLVADFTKDNGYDLRVDPSLCVNWAANP